ncbi:hypothetical protein [Leptothrix ochracea]|uniref:Uncharacterized protein n=1 Tax=Leptothrix ochracea L12 TaxID=735332 RepID=I4Z5D1_9BURK|nr:hypothetical protein [Leptothrix ochracea]EIM31423.1 hypothetical protein LepocDRAFT_00001510 [Leptothrix ochracea L12]
MSQDPDALKQIAQHLDDLAEQVPVDAARTPQEAQSLMEQVQALGSAASKLRLAAIEELLGESSVSLSDIIDATASAHGFIKTVQDLDKAIMVLGDVVALAQAVASGNAPLIGPAMAHLMQDARTA